MQRKAAGKFLLNLNITQRPIAEKYCEGKLKRMLKDKSKEPEIAPREQNGIDTWRGRNFPVPPTRGVEPERRKGGKGGGREVVATCRLKLLWLGEERQVGHRSSGHALGAGVGGQALSLDYSLSSRGPSTKANGFWKCRFLHPVLKHGSRSLTVWREYWCKTTGSY